MFNRVSWTQYTDPYPSAVIYNAVQQYDKLEEDFPDISKMGKSIRMHADMTYPDKGYMDLMSESSAYKDLHDYVYSEGFSQFFLDLFKDDIRRAVDNGELLVDPTELRFHNQPYEVRNKILSKRNLAKEKFLFSRMDMGVGLKGYGINNGGRGVHVDNITRLVSVLLYFTSSSEIEGGEHRMFRVVDGVPEVAREVAPEKNLMIASLQSNHAFHGVNPQRSGVRNGIYLSLSCSGALWAPYKDPVLRRISKNRA